MLFKEIFSTNFNIEILVFLRYVAIFIFLSIYFKNKNQHKKFNFNTLIFVLTTITIDTLFQYFFGNNLLGFEKFQEDRLTGIFDDEPIIGSFILKILIISSTFILFKYPKNFLFSVILIFSSLSVLLSGERMPFLQMLFAYSLIFLFIFRPTFKIFIFLFVLIFISIISISSQPNVKSRYTSTIDGFVSLYNDIKSNDKIEKDYSASHGIKDYYLVLNSGIQLWKNNYIFGNGYRDYRQNCYHTINVKFRDSCSTHPHNIYIEILSDHGVAGLILFLCFLYNLYIEFIKNVINKKYYGFLIASIVISVPFVTSQSIFSSYYGSIYFLLIFMIKIFSSQNTLVNDSNNQN